MTKKEFLDRLREKLAGLPREDTEERLLFYGEMIDDRMEEGIGEEEAVAGIGPVDWIASQIISDIPFSRLIGDKSVPARRLKVWEIVLLALGSPVWIPLAAAAIVLIAALLIVLISLSVCLWAVFAASAGSTLMGCVWGAVLITQGGVWAGIASIGAGTACAGLSLMLFRLSSSLTKAVLLLIKKLLLFAVRRIKGKGDK